MGLKPLNHLQLANPFTEVNGNLCINFNFVNDLFPSAQADGFWAPKGDLFGSPLGAGGKTEKNI